MKLMELKKNKVEVIRMFCDLDGVAADFDKRVIEITGQTFGNGDNALPDDDMWDAIMKVDDFYLNLDVCKGFYRLWEYIAPYSPEILTAIPRKSGMPSAEDEKRSWVKRHLGESVKMHIGPYSRDKKKWAKPGYVLIDDRKSNIDEWNENGGIGILHVYNDVSGTIEQLMKMGI